MRQLIIVQLYCNSRIVLLGDLLYWQGINMNSIDKLIVDELSAELDSIEKTTRMIDGYSRIEPEIVVQEQAGSHFKFILYHQESKAWFGNTDAPDHCINTVKQTSLIKPNDIVFDLGCNSGFHTVWLALQAYTGHVYAFDPYPWNAAATKAQAKLNNLNNVTVYAVGLGRENSLLKTDVTSSKTLNVEKPRPGCAIDLIIRSADDFLHLNPSFLKIDIEGAEHELTYCHFTSHPSLERGYVEMHPDFISAAGYEPKSFLERLFSDGFNISTFDGPCQANFDPVLSTAYFFSRN